MKVRTNHSFCVDWALRQEENASVLDFGCGAGQVVAELRSRGIEAYGCDVYYGGGDSSPRVPDDLFRAGAVRRMSTHKVPFEDARFDLVINNTVLEHVEDLKATLAEIARVLRPGGKVLSLFPQREVWFEWHVGLPLLHRFPPGSRFRLAYTILMRSLGFGFFKGDKPIITWSRDAVAWVDRWTHYRRLEEIQEAFGHHFTAASGLEASWIDHKLSEVALIRRIPMPLKRAVVKHVSGLVFECRKPMDGMRSTSNEGSPKAAAHEVFSAGPAPARIVPRHSPR